MRPYRGGPDLKWSELREIGGIVNRAISRDGIGLFPFRLPQLTADEEAMVRAIVAVAVWREHDQKTEI